MKNSRLFYLNAEQPASDKIPAVTENLYINSTP